MIAKITFNNIAYSTIYTTYNIIILMVCWNHNREEEEEEAQFHLDALFLAWSLIIMTMMMPMSFAEV